MLKDIEYALRQARKAPAFAFAAITTLALGIGAVALVTCLLPALRAARTDLVSALHQD